MRSQLISVWVPADLAAQIDSLAAQAAGTGLKFSRSAWVVDAIRRVLSDAASPALTVHRARLAEAAASENP